jgi:GMP reductase
MAHFSSLKSVYFNDCVVLPSPAKVSSRSEIPLELNRIICSPMSAVIGETFLKAAVKIGLTVCLHRFCDIGEQVKLYTSIPKEDRNNVFCSVGLKDWDRVKELSKEGCGNWLLDIANGYLPDIKPFSQKLMWQAGGNVQRYMAGNVCTSNGAFYLQDNMYLGNDIEYILRIGIANGAACKSYDMTGINRGQITELMECEKTISNFNFRNSNPRKLSLCSDGGVKKAGYAVKAFGAGANYVMIGRMFANALEAETNVKGEGVYYGGASHKQQELYGGVKKHSEGKEFSLEGEKLPLDAIVKELWGGIASGISYTGYSSVKDFIGQAYFELKQNSLPPKQRN